METVCSVHVSSTRRARNLRESRERGDYWPSAPVLRVRSLRRASRGAET
jgi:hypothetical protein